MEFMYVLVLGAEWEDISILVSKEDAVKASIKYPKATVQIFAKENNSTAYKPTYHYYENGKFIDKK